MIYKVLTENQGEQHFDDYQDREDYITEQKWQGNCIIGTCEQE